MTYREFCNEIAPLVVELQAQCKGMTEEDFDSYRWQVLKEIRNNAPGISENFITAVLDLIYKKIFAVTVHESCVI